MSRQNGDIERKSGEGCSLKIGEGVSIGFLAIRANKLRSLLTMLGIVIGVAAVLAMIAVGDGAKVIILQDAEKLGGINQFRMYRSSRIRVGERWVRNRSNEFFEYGDVLAIEAQCPSVALVMPEISQRRGPHIRAPNGAEIRAGYTGVDASYAEGMNWPVEGGRFISEADVANRTRVCVLGREIATELFGTENPINQEIKISYGETAGQTTVERFTVVGVMQQRGRSLRFGWNLDDEVYLPLTTAQERFTGNDYIPMLTVVAKNLDSVYQASEEVKAVMRARHKGRDDFFQMRFMQEGMEQLTRISRLIKITLGSIAGFSLLVGGISIMNMMLVSVTERTREIGLRKAIGAKRSDILVQFLVEAVVMCGIGGLVGIGLGIGAGHGMAHIATKIVKIVDHWPSVVSANWMIISFSVSAAIGISFGLYPAIRAAQLSPIEALRTE